MSENARFKPETAKNHFKNIRHSRKGGNPVPVTEKVNIYIDLASTFRHHDVTKSYSKSLYLLRRIRNLHCMYGTTS